MPSDSPTTARSISRRRSPVATSIDHTWKPAASSWPATNSRPSWKWAPVIPDGGLAPTSRPTALSLRHGGLRLWYAARTATDEADGCRLWSTDFVKPAPPTTWVNEDETV